jgi:hypothetical protein
MVKRIGLLGSILSLVLLTLVWGLPALAEHGRSTPAPAPARLVTQAALPTAPVTDTGPFVNDDHVTILYEFTGEGAGFWFGWVGGRIGDLNDDGADEFIVTSPHYSVTAPFQGRAYVYNGADGALLNTVTGDAANRMGYSTDGGVDVNDDGVPDYIVGGAASYFAQTTGRVLVYSGADHSVLHDLSGEAGASFGSDVAALGDVNDDGYDDFIVGSEFYSSTLGQPFPNGTGRVYVFSGKDGSTLWMKDGALGDWLGSGTGRVSDLDEDGAPEVVAAARGADSFNGRAYVYSGADGDLIHTLAPTEPFSQTGTFGQFFAHGAGDVDADGTEDIFIGDYFALNGDGRAYIYSGTDGSLIRVINSEAPGDGLGPGRGVPDVNGDGHDDLIIAAYTSSEGAPFAGKVSVYSGADGAILHSVTGNVANDWLGVDALPLGDLNDDGYPDYLITAMGLDYGGMGVGNAYVISFKSELYLPLLFR